MTVKLIGGALPSVIHGFERRPIISPQRNLYGGYLINPIENSEPLFVSLSGTADLEANETTSAVEPGATFNVPPGTAVWTNAVSNNFQYTAVFGVGSAQEKPDEVPVGGTRPDWPLLDKNGNPLPTGLTFVIYAYLYQEYSDDDDLQEFVKVLNSMQQDYVDTFNALRLPVYTDVSPKPKDEGEGILEGKLADWAMHGIYGWIRPSMSTDRSKVIGPLNTYWPNQLGLPINELRIIQPPAMLVADDDFYKRSLTWHFQKGDGKYFNVRWLKRRVMRFLIGKNGTSPHIDNTWRISVSFGANYSCTIRIIMRETTVTGGAFPNGFGCNGMIPGRPFFDGPFNPVGPVTPASITSTFVTYDDVDYADVLQDAVAAGILELPFQWRFNVHIG